MEAQPDFSALLALFNENRVEYLIVGGYALGFHGSPRFTGDLDLFVNPDLENARRVVDVSAPRFSGEETIELYLALH